MDKLKELINKFNNKYIEFCELNPFWCLLLHIPFLFTFKEDKTYCHYFPWNFRWRIWYYILKPRFYEKFIVKDVTKHCEIAKGKFSPEKCDKQELLATHNIRSWWDYVMAHNYLPQGEKTDWLKEFKFETVDQIQEYYNYWTKWNMMSNILLRSNENEYYIGTANYGPYETEELRRQEIERVDYKDGDEIGLVRRIYPVFHRYTWILWLTGRWSLIEYIKDAIKYGIFTADPIDLRVPESYKDKQGFHDYPMYYVKYTDSYWHSMPDTLKKLINEEIHERNRELRNMIDHAHGEKTLDEIQAEVDAHREQLLAESKKPKRRTRKKKSEEKSE